MIGVILAAVLRAPQSASQLLAPALAVQAPAAPPARGQPAQGEAPPGDGGQAEDPADAEGAKGPAAARKAKAEAEAAAKAAAEAASARLGAVEDALLRALFAQRPSLARLRGQKPRDEEPPRADVLSGVEWQRALERSAGELALVPWENLTPLRRADLQWLTAWVQAETRLAALLPPERSNPDRCLSEMLALLRGVAADDGAGADRRMAIVTTQLLALPAYLAEARESLTFPMPQACAYALLVHGELERFLKVELIALLEAAGPTPETWGPFEEADKKALRALDEFRDWLATMAGRSEGKTEKRVLGPTAWLGLVNDLSGSDLDLAALKIRLLRDIAALDASLDRFRIAPPPEPEELAPAAIKRLVEETARLAWAELAALEMIPDMPPELGCEQRVAFTFPAELVELRGGKEPALVFTYQGEKWPKGIQNLRLARMGAASQRAEVLQHGLPGEALWESWSRASDREAQRAVWNRCQREGFGLYAADWIVRVKAGDNPLADDEALAAEVRRNRLFEAARLYATLLLHAERKDEPEVVDALRKLTGLDPESAAFEVRSALVDPLRGAGYLGFLELRELEAELAAREAAKDGTGERGKQSADKSALEALRRTMRLVSVSPSVPASVLLRHADKKASDDPARKGADGKKSPGAPEATGDAPEDAE